MCLNWEHIVAEHFITARLTVPCSVQRGHACHQNPRRRWSIYPLLPSPGGMSHLHISNSLRCGSSSQNYTKSCYRSQAPSMTECWPGQLTSTITWSECEHLGTLATPSHHSIMTCYPEERSMPIYHSLLKRMGCCTGSSWQTQARLNGLWNYDRLRLLHLS